MNLYTHVHTFQRQQQHHHTVATTKIRRQQQGQLLLLYVRPPQSSRGSWSCYTGLWCTSLSTVPKDRKLGADRAGSSRLYCSQEFPDKPSLTFLAWAVLGGGREDSDNGHLVPCTYVSLAKSKAARSTAFSVVVVVEWTIFFFYNGLVGM